MGSGHSSPEARDAIAEAAQRDAAHLRQVHPGATNMRADLVDFNQISKSDATGSVRFSYTLPRSADGGSSSSGGDGSSSSGSSSGSVIALGQHPSRRASFPPAPPSPVEVHVLWHYRAHPRADGALNDDGEKIWHATRMSDDAATVAAEADAAKFAVANSKAATAGSGNKVPRPRKTGVGDVSSVS